MDKKDLLQNVFGYKPVNSPLPKPPAEPFAPDMTKVQAKFDAKQPVLRDASPETMASVQAIVWGSGNPPPPKPPAAAMMDQGTAPAMAPATGWGKIG